MEKNYSQRLKEVLYLLASEADIQINAFPEYVHIPDEIVAETSDAIELAQMDISKEDENILETLREIDIIFDKMGESSNNWSTESIKTNPIWQKVRLLAQNQILSQKLVYKHPDLFWISYFRS